MFEDTATGFPIFEANCINKLTDAFESFERSSQKADLSVQLPLRFCLIGRVASKGMFEYNLAIIADSLRKYSKSQELP